MANFNPTQPRDQEGQWTKAEQAAMLSSGLTEDSKLEAEWRAIVAAVKKLLNKEKK